MRELFSICLLLTAVTSMSCGANETVLRSGKSDSDQSNTVVEPETAEKEIQAMRTAGFNFIYVFRRKDGGKMDAEDRSVIKLQTADANRRISAEDDKAFVIGSNPPIPPKNLLTLFDRFATENYSPPLETNINANTNAPK